MQIENSNEWNNWIENAIASRNIKQYEYKNFSNIQEICSSNFGKVYRANWNDFHGHLVLKSFYNLSKTTLKEIVHEIQLRRQMDFHNNIIRFCGIVTENNPKDFFLVMEYADSGTLKNYLKENFKNLTWNDKFDLAFQLVHVVSCLHDEEIVHRNLHSNNILIHQKNIKLANLGLSKRIEEASDPQSIGMIPYVDPKSFTRKRNRDNEIEVYSLNKKSDVYSVGVLLWEISSGRPPFDNEPYDIALAMEIFSGRREIPVSCWDIEPDNRQTMRQITSSIKKIEYETIEANDVNCDEMVIDDHENVVVDNDHVEESIEKDVVNEDHNYDEEMAVEEEHEIEVNDDNIKELIELLSSMKIEEEKHKILEYLNERNITSRLIFNFISANQNNSNSLVILGRFNHLGIETEINEQKAYELYQDAVNLGNVYGMSYLAHCYEHGIGVDVNKQKTFELYQKAADLGNAPGENNLGYCYDYGIGTNVDKEKAFELYKKAKEQGLIIAKYNLAQCYLEGNGVDEDPDTAFELYKELAYENYPDGVERLGYCYQYGTGTNIDLQKALELYREAKKLGSISGMTMLATCYHDGIGTNSNKKKALKLFEEAADYEYNEAQFNLACIYDKGEGVSKDNKKAFELFKKLDESEHPDAICYLAHYYLNGIETSVDKRKALELYQKSANLGSWTAQYMLATMYGAGEGVDKDIKKAFELFNELSENEYPNAMIQLGYYYQHGIGTNVNEEKAYELYKRAKRLDSSVGNDIEKDIERIFSKYEQGSDDDQDEMESSRKSKRKRRNINNE
ncbi:kinase-like protein [Rhizophagus irregularis]|uniref:Kinase-like protein n=1 Tax=Rhizophagus irregularis TaxID=588596 RepID=A0A2I1GCE5_9GLOM|nr:kinase-like protein [Rhizophagus irregularis]